MEKELNVVGTRVPMLDAAQKTKGAALFTDDLVLPGMLYGKILRSPVAHAKIVNIDTSKAEKLPGVKGVVTGQAIPDRQYGIVPMAKDEYALARDKVRYIGDDVAAVCAIDPATAEEALDLIAVDYEELPSVFDPLEAQKDGAPVIHDGVENNTSFFIKKEFGDVAKAFAESDAVFEDTLDEGVNGLAAGTHRHPRKVNPGTKVIQISADGYGQTEQQLTIAELEQSYILRVLEEEQGNKTRTAQRLGLDRKTLYRKLEEYRRVKEA